MSKETSSSGTERVPTSRTESRPKIRYGGTRHFLRLRRNALVACSRRPRPAIGTTVGRATGEWPQTRGVRREKHPLAEVRARAPLLQNAGLSPNAPRTDP